MYPCQDLDQRALARTVCTCQRMYLTGCDVEGHISQRLGVAKSLGHLAKLEPDAWHGG
jgi:hypothetical protein